VTGRESTHIDTAFMGLTSSDRVTVDCKLPARRDTDQSFSRPVITTGRPASRRLNPVTDTADVGYKRPPGGLFISHVFASIDLRAVFAASAGWSYAVIVA
jgi:hypothetical protein